jgi:hypothetical protein
MNETLLKAGFILGASFVVFLLNGRSTAFYKNITDLLADRKKQKIKEKIEPEKINFC